MRSIRIVFLLLPIFLIFSASPGNAQFFEAGVEELRVPVAAPDFKLKTMGNGTIGLDDLKGKIALLTFIEDWCPICKKDASSMDKLARATKGRDVVFLLLAVKWRDPELVKFKKEFNISSPILIDKTGSVAKAYGISGYPETLIINRKGEIVGKTFAKEEWNSTEVKNLLKHLLTAGKGE
jgi:peroxiredoxin